VRRRARCSFRQSLPGLYMVAYSTLQEKAMQSLALYQLSHMIAFRMKKRAMPSLCPSRCVHSTRAKAVLLPPQAKGKSSQLSNQFPIHVIVGGMGFSIKLIVKFGRKRPAQAGTCKQEIITKVHVNLRGLSPLLQHLSLTKANRRSIVVVS
jgi:hypothetical protein